MDQEDVPLDRYAAQETTTMHSDPSHPGMFLIDPTDIVGTVDDYNAISADTVGVISPKKPAPQPPAKSSAQPRYRRILGGVPAWTTKSKKFGDSRQDRQLQNWQKHAAAWDRVDRSLAARTGKSMDALRVTSHRRHQVRTKGQELLDSTRDASNTHTHPGGLQSSNPELWPRLNKFGDQEDATDGHARLTYKHLRDERAGPQFWAQPELRAKSNLPIALKYQNAVHEFIGRPAAMRDELGIYQAEEEGYHAPSLLETMPKHAAGSLPSNFAGVEGWAPDVEDLCIVGRGAGKATVTVTAEDVDGQHGKAPPISEWDRDGAFEDTIEEADEDDFITVEGFPKLGSGSGGAKLKQRAGPWLVCKSSSDTTANQATACRVTFDATVNNPASSYMTLTNGGSTAMHYSWQRAAKVESLGTRIDKIDRFKFDRRPAVILPGDSKKFTFEFTSASAGIYTEQWRLDTAPGLDTAPLITLCGTCNREDVHEGDRADVEKKLERAMIANSLKSMLYNLVRQVQATPRPVSPAEQWVTLESRFKAANLNPDTRTIAEQTADAAAAAATIHGGNGVGGDDEEAAAEQGDAAAAEQEQGGASAAPAAVAAAAAAGGDASPAAADAAPAADATETTTPDNTPAPNHFLYEATPWTGPLGFEERLVKQGQKLYESAWRQHWVQTNFPVLQKPAGEARASVKSGKDKGKADKKGGGADASEEAGPVFTVPTAPEWDLNMSGLKQLLLDLEDGKATALEESGWKSQQSYLDEYMVIAVGVSFETPEPEKEDREVLARELLVRMAEAVAEKCTFARRLQGLPEPNVFVSPPPEIEAYVPRVDLASLGGKGGKKKAPAKDDKKGKDAKKKGGDEDVAPAPEPLAPEVAEQLAPLQFQAAREAVVDMLAEWDTVIPATARVSPDDDY